MTIKLRDWILLVKKNEGAELSQDIYTVSNDDDKNLVSCTVVQWIGMYEPGKIIITGKYSLSKMVYKWEDYFFVEVEDVIWFIEE
jgi:hypothetical protein